MRSSLLGAINAGATPSVAPAAQAFLDATGITDETITTAINDLYNSLDADGIWDKCDAIYPFVGGTADTHKYNLKDPQDTNGAFRITWAGTVTHNANGITGNGTTGYGDTNYNPTTTALSLNDNHLSLYCRTTGANEQVSDFAMRTATVDNAFEFNVRRNNTFTFRTGQSTTQLASVANTDAQGFYIGSRRTSTDVEIYKNGASEATNTNATAGALGDANLFICCLNFAGVTGAIEFTSRNYAFASIGSGLSDTEAANFYTAVQAFQTALSRNV